MLVRAIVAIGAHAVFGVVLAFGHAPKVVLVQEFAVVAFFAKGAHPVLAY